MGTWGIMALEFQDFDRFKSGGGGRLCPSH